MLLRRLPHLIRTSHYPSLLSSKNIVITTRQIHPLATSTTTLPNSYYYQHQHQHQRPNSQQPLRQKSTNTPPSSSRQNKQNHIKNDDDNNTTPTRRERLINTANDAAERDPLNDADIFDADDKTSSSLRGATSSSSSMKTQQQSEQQERRHDDVIHKFAPRICVVGIGGAGGNAVNNMIKRNLSGVDFLALNTDSQHLSTVLTDNRLQIGVELTNGLGCGANPDAGRQAAEESREQIAERIQSSHMVFITAGMGGGTGTGAAPIVAELCYNANILTVAVVTKPFLFEGSHRMRIAEEGLDRLRDVVDTLIVIPNQNIFSMIDETTSFRDSFALADDVLLAGVKSITDLMTVPGMINLDFADVQTVMHGMGNAMLGTGQAEGEERAVRAAEEALTNPLLGHMEIGTAKGMLVNITGGDDMTLWEMERAAQRITESIQDENANIIFGSSYDKEMDGSIRVSVVATGIEEQEGS